LLLPEERLFVVFFVVATTTCVGDSQLVGGLDQMRDVIQTFLNDICVSCPRGLELGMQYGCCYRVGVIKELCKPFVNAVDEGRQ
jgi:hypothetical protein